jgi:hypothetical protein
LIRLSDWQDALCRLASSFGCFEVTSVTFILSFLLFGFRARLARKADSLAAICEPTD